MEGATKYEYQRNLRKKIPPAFNGQNKKVEEGKTQLQGIKKYFKAHDYCENMRARVAIFNLKGKADIWWEELSNIKAIRERDFLWSEFEKYCRDKYMPVMYYDAKVKKFHELKLGQLIVDESRNTFLKL